MIATDVREVQAAVSSGEQRFENTLRSIGFFAGPIVLLVLLLVPLPGLSVPAHRLAAIVAFTMVWWITEAVPIPVTALVATALTVFFGVASAQDAFAPFASPTIFVFLGAFIIGRAVTEHDLDGRMARAVLALRFIRNDLGRSRNALGILTVLISAWMNNTATAAMMTPVARGVIGTGHTPRQGYATGLMLVVGYAASVGGMLTPIGAAPNLITIGLLDTMAATRLNFVEWIVLCAPIALAVTGTLLAVTSWFFPAGSAQESVNTASIAPTHERSRAQRNCLIAFGVAVTLWIAPGLLALAAPQSALNQFAEQRLDEGVIAIAAASMLFILPVSWRARRFTLTWKQGADIDWGTILMFGGGLALGRLMLVTGLAKAIGEALVAISGAETLWGITAMAAAIAIILTELVSNTAAISMLVPVIIGICEAAGVNPVAPSMAVCLGGSLGFMLPISTPPNAIAYGTGLVPLSAMMRVGIILDVIGFGIILTGLRILCPLLGYS